MIHEKHEEYKEKFVFIREIRGGENYV